mmetsp:Transcript_15599/g.26433  ORF Transcript_15599/g.26433 Transcript_15599/m.26433 type:complete len:104 (-) Transcript_15599:764-1075(-)
MYASTLHKDGLSLTNSWRQGKGPTTTQQCDCEKEHCAGKLPTRKWKFLLEVVVAQPNVVKQDKFGLRKENKTWLAIVAKRLLLAYFTFCSRQSSVVLAAVLAD